MVAVLKRIARSVSSRPAHAGLERIEVRSAAASAQPSGGARERRTGSPTVAGSPRADLAEDARCARSDSRLKMSGPPG